MRHLISKTPYGTHRFWVEVFDWKWTGPNENISNHSLHLKLVDALKRLSCWGNSDARLENFCDTGVEFVGFEIPEGNLARASICCTDLGSVECDYHPSTGLVPCQR